MKTPAMNSIITLTAPVLDENGDALLAGQDVVVLEAHDDGSILVSADNEAGEEVVAWVHEREWEQRPEETREIHGPSILPAGDVAALLRRVASKEDLVLPALLDDVTFEVAYSGTAIIAVDTLEGRWWLSIFNDCGEVDYIEVAVAPDGRSGDFDLWWDEVGGDPLGELSQDDFAQFEGIIYALSPKGRLRCQLCGMPAQLERGGLWLPCEKRHATEKGGNHAPDPY